MLSQSKKRRQLLTGLGFLLPNIVGVMCFTILPVIFAILLALTDWDLRKHNMFKQGGLGDQLAALDFVGIDNFLRLVFGTDQNIERFWSIITLHGDPAQAAYARAVTEAQAAGLDPGIVVDAVPPLISGEFLQAFGNTLFLMMGIPFGIAASLGSAMLLNANLRAGGGKTLTALLISALLAISLIMLTLAGAIGTASVLFFGGLACLVLMTGMVGGQTVYRTLFYTPHFTAGVATFILWRKLYNPNTGPINQLLSGPLEILTGVVQATPPGVVQAGMVVCMALMLLLLWNAWSRFRRGWVDGELGWRAMILPGLFTLLPLITAQVWSFTEGRWPTLAMGAIGAVVVLWSLVRILAGGRDFKAPAKHGFGNALVLALVSMIGMFILLGFSAVFNNLPAMAADADGIQPPQWLTSVHWAKPSLMLMGFWGAIGSNTMLLYLAALTNVPRELYEAADIDGASRFQQFWNVTWPQLAPTTFFVAVMAVIGGLQGGFEAARVMTQGGPAGATTTMSYFIYQQGFETGRLSYSAGAAWALFILVFSVTLFNWKFGNKYVND